METSAVSANVENADSSLAEPAVVSGAEIAEQARLVLPEQTLPEPAPTSTASLRALDSAVSPTGAEEKIEEKIEGKIEDKIAENVSSALETCVPENVADPSASLSVAQPVAETATAPTPAESVSPEPSAGEPAAAEPKTDATSLELLAEGLPLHGKMTMRANTPVAAPFAVAAPLAIAGPPEPYLLAAPSQDHKAQDHKAQDHKAMIESAPLASQLTRPKREPALVKVQMRLTMPVAPVVANNPAQSMVLEVEVAPQKDLAQAPDLPARFPSPRMGRLLRYSPVAKRTIVPAAPSREPLKSSVEVMGTIPAPMLPAALVSFKDPGLRPQFLEQAVLRKSSSWGQLFLVALLGIGLGLGVHYLYVSYMHPPEADADVAEDSAPASTPAAAVASSPGNGFTKSMEVTGFRIVVDPTRKTEIHYIVVNHSGVRFPDAKVSVTLYSTDARVGQPPLCHFSFAVPNLGPFEAKEMVSSLESSPAGNPPEWRDLRAEVSIGQ